MLKGNLARRWAALWPLLALCLLGGSRWLLEGARPSAQSTYLSQASGCFGAASLFGLADLLARRRVRRLTDSRSRERGAAPRSWAALGGTCALAGAGLAATISRRPTHTDDASLALAITPCVIAVATTALGSTDRAEMTAKLWPGLAAVAGLLLLLPQPRIQDWRQGAALAAMPLLTGIGAAMYASGDALPGEAERSSAKASTAWIVLVLAGLVYAGLAWLHSRTEGVSTFPFTVTKEAFGLDGTMAFLSVLTLLRAGAVGWSAQFVLLPLLALLEGVVFLRPELDGRSWLAFALLLISGVYLISLMEGEVPRGAAAERGMFPT